MICEMCGSDKSQLNLVEVDGAILKVCPNCAKFGVGKKEERDIAPDAMSAPIGTPKKKGAYSRDVFDAMGDDELIDDYGKVIRQSRSALGWSQEDLAKKINEKKSQIAKIESGSYIPPDDLVKKLEKALKVKLTEKYESRSQSVKPKEAKPVTLKDLVK